MDIADWRKKIDELDRRLVELLSERARAAVEIGRLKRNTNLPIYEPERERIVFENVQRDESGSAAGAGSGADFRTDHGCDAEYSEGRDWGQGGRGEGAETELDSEVND